MLQHCLALLLLAVTPAMADPPPSVSAPGITILELGIFCKAGTSRNKDAPDTSLGYVRELTDSTEMAFDQQQVPIRIGSHFGLTFLSDHDIPALRNETWKPGATMPELWTSDVLAGAVQTRGYSLDFPEELLPGLWRFDAYEGDRQIYSVTFELLPADQLPGIGSDCDLLS
jgi:Domain of unknown function (DUF3859)